MRGPEVQEPMAERILNVLNGGRRTLPATFPAPAPAQMDILREYRAAEVRREFALDAAATLASLALKAFAVAKDGDLRANELGTRWLDEAERLFAEGRHLGVEAAALWRRLEA